MSKYRNIKTLFNRPSGITYVSQAGRQFARLGSIQVVDGVVRFRPQAGYLPDGNLPQWSEADLHDLAHAIRTHRERLTGGKEA